ncbi:hypothetical protein VTK26DRAFT_7491 [Humicola hyalothermophila]
MLCRTSGSSGGTANSSARRARTAAANRYRLAAGSRARRKSNRRATAPRLVMSCAYMVSVPASAKKGRACTADRCACSGGSARRRICGRRCSCAMAGCREGSMKSRMWRSERWVRAECWRGVGWWCRGGGEGEYEEEEEEVGERVRSRTWAMS